MSILHVVGARPNFMKVAPVMAAIRKRAVGEQYLIHTGQHYDANMSEIFFTQLGLPRPDENLNVGSGTHAVQTGEIMSRLESIIDRRRPDIVVVYGDVNSTLAAALVCSKLLVTIAHVEAGLRSFDHTMPEEVNRLVTDRLADILLTPSEDADRNLLREGVEPRRIHKVGNVMIDTLTRLLPIAEAYPRSAFPARYALVTLHRPSNVDEPAALEQILRTLLRVSDGLDVVFPVHPRTRQRIERLGMNLDKLHLRDPSPYIEFLALQRHDAVVMTDSGGIQEETTYLGIPCLTLRKNTERPVTITAGTNIMVGKDSAVFEDEIRKILDGKEDRVSTAALGRPCGRAYGRRAGGVSGLAIRLVVGRDDNQLQQESVTVNSKPDNVRPGIDGQGFTRPQKSITWRAKVTTMDAVSEDAMMELKGKIDEKTANIGVIGLGYVGLPLSLLYVEQDSRLPVLTSTSGRLMRSEGRSYIYRIPAEEIQEARSKSFVVTSDFSKLSKMDAIIICVPTPLNEHHEPDLSFITDTARSIAPYLRAGQLVILESTTYPGTTEEVLVPILEEGNRESLKADRSLDVEEGDEVFYVAFSPEREDPGNTAVPRHDIPKVIGGLNPVATELASALYGTIFKRTIPVSSPAAAEMTKLLENIYRCVNIAMVNELKLLCLRMGLDIWEVIDAASTKPFGFHPFYPGPGLGGHCIPIDPFYLSWKAKEWDFQTRFIELAGEINTSMPYHVVTSVASALNRQQKALNGANVLVLGVAYKKDIDDLRESPALTIIELLQGQGATVSYNDPYLPFIGKGRKYDLQMRLTPLENLGQYDCVLIVTDHSNYDYASIVESARLVVDTRNATKGISDPRVVRC